MENLKIDLYGPELADYRKAKVILEDIKKVEGCSDASFYTKQHTHAGFTCIAIEWISENKVFLLALATFLYMILRDAYKKSDPKYADQNKIKVSREVTLTHRDSIREIEIKLKEYIGES